MLDELFTRLDTDESGEIDILEFAAVAGDEKADRFRVIYLEMEKT